MQILFFDKNVVGVVGRNREQTDFVCGENAGELGENPDQRKVERSLNAKAAPAVLTRGGADGRVGGSADERDFFVGFGDEIKRLCQVERRGVRRLADRQVAGQYL